MEKQLSITNWPAELGNKRVKCYKKQVKTILEQYARKNIIEKTNSLLDTYFLIENFDYEKGLILCSYRPNKDFNGSITINRKDKTLKHECRDFRRINKLYKRFCPHIIKMFQKEP